MKEGRKLGRAKIEGNVMASISSPQQQAGVLSFYDAPEKGPKMNARLLLIGVSVFAIVIIILDHFVVLK